MHYWYLLVQTCALHLALADGNLGKEEAAYIRVVATSLNIPLGVLEQYGHGEPDLVLPDREYKLYSLFHRLVLIIMIDGVIDEAEERTCFDLGIKMGLHPNAVGEIIHHVTAADSDESPQEIIAIFKRYMN